MSDLQRKLGKKNGYVDHVTYGINIGLTIFIFIFMYGFHVLDVTNVAWLRHSPMGGDITQHYIGWLAYRKSSWHFPLGMGEGLGYPSTFTIINTDSIPILAFIFKLFRGILPAHFQYFGLYGLFSYIMQAWFVTKIFNKYKIDRFYSAMATIMLCFHSVMLLRTFYHTALGSQWLILWVIYIYLENTDPGKDPKNQGNKKPDLRLLLKFAAIGFLTVSIHTYFLLLCGLVLFGLFLYEIIRNRKYLPVLLYFITYCASALFGLWLWGAFTIGVASGDNFGKFALNLNAFINPMGWGNGLLPSFPTLSVDQSYESCIYMGAGIYLMLVLLLVCFLVKKENRKRVTKDRPFLISLIAVLVLSLLLAISPSVSLGNRTLFTYPVPDPVLRFWTIFRATGRIAWVYFYLVIVLGFVALYKMIPEKYKDIQIKSILIACIFIIQIIDILPLSLSIRGTFKQDYEKPKITFSDPIWESITTDDSIKHIVFFNAEFASMIDTVHPVTEFALDHDLTVNQFYFARTENEEKKEEAIRMLLSHDNTAAYVFCPSDFEDESIVKAIEDSGIEIKVADSIYVGVFD